MFSETQNIETISQLIEAIKRYLGNKSEYLKLTLIEKVSAIITALIVILFTIVMLFIVLILLSIAIAYCLTPYTGNAIAFLIVACLHLFIYTILYFYRKTLLRKPLVKLIAHIILK